MIAGSLQLGMTICQRLIRLGPMRVLNHTRNGLTYRVPHTQTILDLRYGPRIGFRSLAVLFSVVTEELAYQVNRHGPEAKVREGEYDYVSEEKVELSVYSPSQLPEVEQLTWHILKNVVDGLMDILILQKRHRQVTFTVTDGPGRRFVGYGHVVQRMGHQVE